MGKFRFIFVVVFLWCLLILFMCRKLEQGHKMFDVWKTTEVTTASHELCSTFYGQTVSQLTASSKINPDALQRLVILGAGPTGLGAAHRLYELGIMRANTQVIILETQSKPGGLAISQRDKKGFLWDMGGHVVFSHYRYFDDFLDKSVKDWTRHKRAAFAFMKGSSGKRRFIPYPVQENVLALDELEQRRILQDIAENLARHPSTKQPSSFDEWLLKTFGKELCDVFMRKYNRKVWTVDPKDMNYAWTGERVAVPSLKKIKANYARLKGSEWGPNRIFRFPKYSGTGGIWQSVANLLPKGWFHFKHKVTGIDIRKKTLRVMANNNPWNCYNISYDFLISTAPLENLVNMDKSGDFVEQKNTSLGLVYSRTHVVGFGLKGKPPKHLADKSWMYFPDSDSPFYRVTVFSKYSNDSVPDPNLFWSLLCESAEPKSASEKRQWSRDKIVNATITALVKYGFIKVDQVVSKWHRRLDHGYPVPSLERDSVLTGLQRWLQSRGIYSRGRFGGWRYEVSNQDHSLMQGVEVVDLLLRGIPEETYAKPNLVNSMKASNRTLAPLKIDSLTPDYEIVVAHYHEVLTWLLPEAKHCYIYHKGRRTSPDFRFKQWHRLPNVGREAHTYLYHIVNNYDHLANVTLFIQGSREGHQNNKTYPNPMEYIREARLRDYSVRQHRYFDSWENIGFYGKWRVELLTRKMRKSNFTVGEFWYKAFGKPHPPSTEWSSGAFFAVTRKRILRKPRSFYAHLMTFVDDHLNPEEGHFFERSWHGVFFGY